MSNPNVLRNSSQSAVPRFEALAQDIAAFVKKGVLRPGDRLPSIRETSKARRLSITTVRRAYGVLEARGLIETRPQSGHFVRAHKPAAAPDEAAPRSTEALGGTDLNRLVLQTQQGIAARRLVPFASPYPDPALLPWQRLHRRTYEVARRFDVWDPLNDVPPGQPELVREIARRHLHNGLDVAQDEIIVTAGATEAIRLGLQAVARPGARIAVESPCYYGALETIKSLGMHAVEVAAYRNEGVDLDTLAHLFKYRRVDACVLMPNFQNPLGFRMGDDCKRELVELARRYGVPIIENGVYNELYYDRPPSTLKAFDTDGLVLHCGSFSKSVAAGLRLGWVVAGRFARRVEMHKFLGKSLVPGVAQMALARFLREDAWDRQLRALRRTLEQRGDIMASLVERFFPAGTRASTPRGGYLMWLELPEPADTQRLYHQALAQGIAIAPGSVFGTAPQLRHGLRLNYSYEWSAETERAFRRLARLARAGCVATETDAAAAETLA